MPTQNKKLTGEHKRSFPIAKRKTKANLIRSSPEALLPSPLEKRRGDLTLANDIEDVGGISKLLDLRLQLYKVQPPKEAGTPLNSATGKGAGREWAGGSTKES